MKSIHYAADEFLTGDDIADALVHLAEALAQYETSLAVDVPVRFSTGDVMPVSFLLGPASQLVAVPSADTTGEIEDAELVASLKHLTATVGRSSAGPLDSAIVSRPSDDFDL